MFWTKNGASLFSCVDRTVERLWIVHLVSVDVRVCVSRCDESVCRLHLSRISVVVVDVVVVVRAVT